MILRLPAVNAGPMMSSIKQVIIPPLHFLGRNLFNLVPQQPLMQKGVADGAGALPRSAEADLPAGRDQEGACRSSRGCQTQFLAKAPIRSIRKLGDHPASIADDGLLREFEPELVAASVDKRSTHCSRCPLLFELYFGCAGAVVETFRLSDDVLDIARIESGKAAVDAGEIDAGRFDSYRTLRDEAVG